MKTYILNSGVQLLQDQSNSVIPSIMLTGFEIGDGVGEVVDRDSTTVVGELLYTGTIADIHVTPLHSNEVTIQCIVPKAVLEMQPGNIVLRANDDKAFSISILEKQTFKLETTDTTVGTRFTFNLILNLPNLSSRFDFSNLDPKLTTFKTFETDLDVTRWPWEELVTQIFVEEDQRTALPAIAVTTNREYWSNPHFRAYDETFYKTWFTEYPWLISSPYGDVPARQANWLAEEFWSGWGPTPVNDELDYLELTNGIKSFDTVIYEVNEYYQVGTLVIEAETASSIDSYDQVLWQWDNGSEQHVLKIFRDKDDSHLKFVVEFSSNNLLTFDFGEIGNEEIFKVAVSWRQGYFYGKLNSDTMLTNFGMYSPFPKLTHERECVNSLGDTWGGQILSIVRFKQAFDDLIVNYV